MPKKITQKGFIMGFRINTNVSAMNAHMLALNNNRNLDKSLAALGSGLRINKASDDASGMAIANQLRSQAQGLGQAIRNANDGVSVAQTADGALEEYTNIINTIRTKAIQAASDSQSSESRAAIQRDIDKLLEEAQNIAKTTSFNGISLLDGTFTDKKFQIGAYSNESIGMSIDSVQTNAIGKIAEVTTVTGGTAALKTLASTDIVSNDAPSTGEWAGPVASTSSSTGVRLNGYNVSGNLTAQGSDMLSAKGIAAAINAMTIDTNVTATAKTTWEMDNSVSAGTISSGELVINGVDIGNVTVKANDADGALVAAINAKKSDTGVTASVDSQGVLTLTADDGRNIQITNTSGSEATLINGGSSVNNESVVAIDVSDDAGNGDTLEFTLDGVLISFTGASADATASSNLLTALENAQNNGKISSNYSFNDATGIVTIKRTDGKDINILNDSDNTTEVAITYNANFSTGGGGTASANGVVYNNARHGQVTLSSSENITIDGDTSTLQTFGLHDGTSSKSVSASGGIADANVLTYEAAQTTIKRMDSALNAIDAIRSEIGSVQNQFESTIRNISVTQVNVTAAESQIRDVDFAAESANLQKLNILAQSGVYALSQANAAQQNVMRLLQ